MLNVRIEGYHALEILHYQAGTLNDLLSQIPHDVALQDARAAAHIAKRGPAWRLWDAICDIEPRPESNRIGPVAAGKLLARKRPCLLPVYDSRINKILNRPRTDNQWWQDLHHQLINDPGLIPAAAYTDPGLRSPDAIHLATAEQLRSSGKTISSFVTYDSRLAQAASSAGFTAQAPT